MFVVMNWPKAWSGSLIPEVKLGKFFIRLKRESSSWLSWLKMANLKINRLKLKPNIPPRKMILSSFSETLVFCESLVVIFLGN